MKVVLLGLFIACGCACYRLAGSSSQEQTRAAAPSLNGRNYVWAGTGLTLTLPDGWRRTNNDEPFERAWAGPDKLSLSIQVAAETPEWGNTPIDEQTKRFYEDHRKAGEQELRYLTVDGVNGVHYLRPRAGFDNEAQTIIIWNGLRLFRGKGQLISVQLVSPAGTFAQNRELLYQLLAAIKFGEQAMTSPGDNASDEVPVRIGIVRSDEFYLGKQSIGPDRIVSEIDRILRDRPEEQQLVYIRALPDVSYGTIVGLVHDLGLRGYEQVGLVAGSRDSNSTSLRNTTTGKAGSAQNSSTGQPSSRAGYLVVIVRISKGQPVITVDGIAVPVGRLSAYVHSALQPRTVKLVMLEGDPNAKYELIVSIVEQLKAGGADSIGLDGLKD